MGQMNSQQSRVLPYILVATAFGLFVAFFAAYHERLGDAVAALAIVPITVGSWYLGIRGGILTAIFSIVSYMTLRAMSGYTFAEIFAAPSAIIGAFALVFVGVVSGRLATITHERRDALIRLAHSSELIYSLLHVTTHIERALNPDEIIQALGEELRKIDLSCAIALSDQNQKAFTINHLSLDQNQLDEFEKESGFSPINYMFSPNLSSLHVSDILQHAVTSNPHDEFQLLFPQDDTKNIAKILQSVGVNPNIEILRLLLMFEEKLLGILWVWGNGITGSDLPVMSIFAKQIGLSLERARLFQEVQDLALTDPLTGLHNRRSLFELGRIEFSRAERLSRPFSCLMMDLDHFKQINDTYGHPTGDKVLQGFARLCKESVREIDLIGRYGGEELMILMPETDIGMANQVAERLRASIYENQMTVDDQVLNVTVSIGVATKDENTLELDTLIARADQAMYIAKHRGRNRVAVSK